MTQTRARGYTIGADGSTGDIVAVGTLILPYLALFDPDSLDPGPDGLVATLDGLDRGSHRVRVALDAGADGSDTVDGVTLLGRNREVDTTKVVVALLDRPSVLPTTPLDLTAGSTRRRRVLSHFETHATAMSLEDRQRSRPVAPPSVPVPVQPPASDWPPGTWPPKKAGNTEWRLERPDWWPPLLPFPLPYVDVEVTTQFCPFCFFHCCSK